MPEVSELKENIESTAPYSWKIRYQGAVCKFNTDDPEIAIIHHLNVPEEIRRQGIGSALVRSVESFLRGCQDVTSLHAQIGNEGGTEDFLRQNEFEIIGTEYSESLGEVVDARKRL